ncbi:3440_t:CDS:2, partial [Cetraspora pellucida]
NNSPHIEISKRRLLETLMIPDNIFKQAMELCVGMKFDHWDYAYLTGFVWRIQEKKLDKNSSVYKYVFVFWHASKFYSNKTATDPLQQHNRESIKTEYTCFINMCWPLKSSNPTVTKINLEHHGHVLSPNTICFANIY